ncbi:MAG: metallophosphoesterase [Lachnospiraceae bacterium]|nr:metallophosphoesterase [Lachnospiraceae bacterium]
MGSIGEFDMNNEKFRVTKKYGRGLFPLLFLMGVLCSFTACGRTEPRADLIVASDIHYITPRINDNGAMFQSLINERDGRAMLYIEEITEAFVDEVIEKKPEALIVTGDLTFNGAIESHEDLAKKFSRLEENGIDVLVLPGNHDVYSGNAARFSGESFERLESPGSDKFKELYHDFGYSEALDVDENSASYIYDVNDTLRVLMLDFNTYDAYSDISEETLSWTEKVLKQAKKDGVYVLACGHQNIFTHHKLFMFGYVIARTDKLTKLFEKYGVEVFLSGHLHTQHYVKNGKVTEILTSALPLYPNQYGKITFYDGIMDYEAVETKVDAPGFEEYAIESFERMSNPTRLSLAESSLTAEEQKRVVDFFTFTNFCYYSGDMVSYGQSTERDEIKALWDKSGLGYRPYLELIEEDSGKDFKHLRVKLK